MRSSVTGAFGVPGENDNERIVEFMPEKGLCVGNKYFEHKGCKGSRWNGGKEHYRFDAGQEECATLFTGCKGSEKHRTSPLR